MDGSALAIDERDAPTDWQGAPLAPAAEPTTTIRLLYSKQPVGRTYVQTVAVPVREVEQRLYDLVLVAWGKSRKPTELEFVIAIDETGAFLGNAEGLMLYCAHNMQAARDDLYDVLNDQGGEDL